MPTNPYASPSLEGASPERAKFWRSPTRVAMGLLLVVFLSCGGLCVYQDEPFTPVYVWDDVGPVQVVANDEELWVFVQIDHWKHLPGKLVSAPSRTTGHYQKVIQIDREGVVQETRVTPDDGPSFHPNRGDIFRFENDFLLFEGPSSGIPANLYRWQENHFQQLSADETVALLKALGLETSNNRLAAEEYPSTEGWQRLAKDSQRWFSPIQFNWSEVAFSLSYTEGSVPNELQLHATTENGRWSATLATFDTTWQEK